MKKLLKLAESIKDVELRKKVVELLKNPSLSNKSFKKYKREDMKKVKTLFTVTGYGTVERGDLLKHTETVTELSIKIADVLVEKYGINVNYDYLIAGALLHDVMKVFEWNLEKGEVKHTGILLDHSSLGLAELYCRGFPEEVVHIVSSHLGEQANPPKTIEAIIVHHADTLSSIVEALSLPIKDLFYLEVPESGK